MSEPRSAPDESPGKTLISLRETFNLSRSEVASLALVSYARMFRVEIGLGTNGENILLRLAKVYDVAPSVVFAANEATRRAAQAQDNLLEEPNHLADLRGLQSLSQEALADRAGVHVSTISKIERGLLVPERSTVSLIAKALRYDYLVVAKACGRKQHA